MAGFLILAAACSDGGIEKASLRVATSCPSEVDRSDGAIIAIGILTCSSDELLFDAQELADLTEEVDGVLSLIRSDHAYLNQIHAKENSIVFGELVVGVEPDLGETIHELLAESQDMVEFVTGNDAFDSLNARLQLSGVRWLFDVPSVDFVTLCFSDRLNVPAASKAYSTVKGVRSAEPGQLSDGPDVDALRKDGTWYVIFRDAWGDCPAGCIEEELFFFKVTGEEVAEVDSAQAASDASFAELIPLVGSRSLGIGR